MLIKDIWYTQQQAIFLFHVLFLLIWLSQARNSGL